MSNETVLQGQTIVFTGQPRSQEVLQEVERLGGEVQLFPLIRTHEVTSSRDRDFLSRLSSYDWLIFTSQNAVLFFLQKMSRYNIQLKEINMKIAVVGTSTARAIEDVGLPVSFIPTNFSAEAFVQQFPQVSDIKDTCLFLRGSLAKDTIKEGLSQQVDEWTVYETLPNMDNSQRLSTYITQRPNVIIAFASPSAVEVFADTIASQMGWAPFKIAAIGHVTATTLENYGAPVHVQPTTYTWVALIQEIAKWKDDSNE